MICSSDRGARSEGSLSLDEYELNQQAQLSALLVDFFSVLDDDGKTNEAMKKLSEMPPLVVNPYRPPKGKKHCEQLTLLSIQEWAEHAVARELRKKNAPFCRAEICGGESEQQIASAPSWLLEVPPEEAPAAVKRLHDDSKSSAGVAAPPPPVSVYAYSVFEATRFRGGNTGKSVYDSVGRRSQDDSMQQTKGVKWRW